MALEPKLIKLPVVKGSKSRGQATEHPNQRGLRGDDVNDETKPSVLCKLEGILDFTFYIRERVSRRQKVRNHVVAAVRRKTDVSNLVRGFERSMYQVAASPDMFRPWDDVTSETHIGPGLEALQSASFGQFIAKLTESKSCIVISQVWAGYHA